MSDTIEQPDAHTSWTVSLAFWLALLAAIGMYALVALSPKLLSFIQLRHDYHATQVRLAGLEHEVEDLNQVVDSLSRDADFVRKLASVEFGARRAGEERIAVDEHLQLSIRDNDPVFEMPTDSLPWYGSAVYPFAVHPRLRGTLLLAAGLILVFAFVFLQPTSAASFAKKPSAESSSSSGLWVRYRRPM
ncbi:MAG: hypothetical protein FD138_4391 [Planctomycetota bacterium]|nr:MAG: hypothetical protein FD138_4391 [Planctomycetota bacterium]